MNYKNNRNIIKKQILIGALLFISTLIFSQQNQNKSTPIKYLSSKSDSTNKRNNKDNEIKSSKASDDSNNNTFLLLLPSIISLLGFAYLRYELYKKFKEQRKQFEKNLHFSFINDFSETLANFISELNPAKVNYKKLKESGFTSEKHELLHTKLTIMLNDNNELEKRFITNLNEIKTNNENISSIIKLLEKLGNEIINNRKKIIYETTSN